MKRFFLITMAVVWVTAAATSCNNEKTVQADELPAAASTFLSTYFPDATVAFAKKERKGPFGVEYTVHLNDGSEIEFDKTGDWTSVEGARNEPIPTGFFPHLITTYVSNTFPDASISDIVRERDGFEVELTNGTDLKFDAEGHFRKID